MQIDGGMIVSTIFGLFMVWFVTFMTIKILEWIGDLFRARKFKKIIKNDKNIEINVESFNSRGVPTSVSYKMAGHKNRVVVWL